MGLKHILSTLMLGLLVGCGTGGSDPTLGGAIFSNLKTRITGGPEAAPPQITRAFLEQAPGKIILVEVPSNQAIASLQPSRDGGDVVTWLSSDGISLTTVQGILIASRGFGDDLMAADAQGLLTALQHQKGHYTRRMQFLDGLDQLKTHTFKCNLDRSRAETIVILGKSHPTTRLTETCDGGQVGFTNHYWMQSGVLWRSEQWLSVSVGALIIQRVQ